MDTFFSDILGSVSALLVLAGLVLPAMGCASRLTPHLRQPLVWLAAVCLCGHLVATLGVHVVLFTHVPPLAYSAVSMGVGLILLRGTRWPACPSRAWTLFCIGRHRWFAAVLGCTALAVMLRAAYLPPLAWDSLTYHYVKPALWLQTGELDPYLAGGGWRIYRLFPGTWETLIFWTMVPWQSDAFAFLPDLVAWALLGTGSYQWSRQQGILGREARLIALIALSLPVVWRAVGSGYVENMFCALLLWGLIFTDRFRRTGRTGDAVLAALALGLAGGYKLFSLPIAGLVGLALIGCMFRKKSSLLAVLAVVIVATAGIAPWWIHNLQMGELPLSPIPVKLGFLELGRGNPVIDTYLDRPGLTPYAPAAELAAFGMQFRWPWADFPGFAPWGWGWAAFGLWGTLRLRNPFARGCAWAIALLTAILFWGPGFSINRLTWPESNARFLLPGLLVLLPGLFHFLRHRIGRRISCLLIALQFLPFWGWGFARVEWALLPVGLLSLAMVLRGLAMLRHGGRGWCAAAVLVLVLLGGPGWLHLKQGLRFKLLTESALLHPISNYWHAAARHVATLPGTTIHVHHQPWQNADNGMVHYFLGNRLQHRLVWSDSSEVPATDLLLRLKPSEVPAECEPVVAGPGWGLYRPLDEEVR